MTKPLCASCGRLTKAIWHATWETPVEIGGLPTTEADMCIICFIRVARELPQKDKVTIQKVAALWDSHKGISELIKE